MNRGFPSLKMDPLDAFKTQPEQHPESRREIRPHSQAVTPSVSPGTVDNQKPPGQTHRAGAFFAGKNPISSETTFARRSDSKC